MKRATLSIASAVALVLSTSQPAAAESFQAWTSQFFAERMRQQMMIDAGSRSASDQVENPVAAANATSVVDTSSAADLLSLALNLSDLTATSEDATASDTTSASATVTAYALYSALEGFDPLSPDNYCDPASQRARRLSLTVGRDDGSGGAPSALIVGAKLSLGEDICNASMQFDALTESIQTAAGGAARIHSDVREELATGGLSERDVVLKLDTDGELRAKAERRFAELADERYELFTPLASDVQALVRSLEERQGYGVQFLTKQREGGIDEYSVKLLYETGVLPGVIWTVNASGEFTRTPGAADSNGGKVSTALRWAPAAQSLRGRRPLQLVLAGDASWMSHMDDTYRGQAKLVLPIADGIEFPISVTVANRTALVDEAEVRGLVGFTVDTTRIVRLLSR